MNRTIKIGTGMAAALSMAATASAGLMNDLNAMAAFQGREELTIVNGAKVAIEYAVYEPGQFALSYPGQDPSSGLEYVYAYQLDNSLGGTRTASQLSVGLEGDEGVTTADVTFIDGTNVNPDQMQVLASAGSVVWDFNPAIPIGSLSDILLFTSPAGPERGPASIQAGGLTGLNTNIPNPQPVPEPVGIMVLGAAGILLTLRRKH